MLNNTKFKPSFSEIYDSLLVAFLAIITKFDMNENFSGLEK